MAAIYRETFDDGPGGWLGWNFCGPEPLDLRSGVAIARGPWWVDYNHAPPGGGYLHLLYCLHTHARHQSPDLREICGPNRFVEGGYPLDFTYARFSLRLRGQLLSRGAQLVLLAQGDLPGRRVNQVLTAQPFHLTPDWSEQTIVLEPDQSQWVQLGSRYDRTATTPGNSLAYGEGPIAELLSHLDVDIILVLFPLQIVPVGPLAGDMHELRAGADYPVDYASLPAGQVEVDTITIEFKNSSGMS